MRTLCVCFIFLSFAGICLFAQEQVSQTTTAQQTVESAFLNYQEPEVAQAPSMAKLLFKLFASLLVVVVLILCVLMAMKKVLSGTYGSVANRKLLKVVDKVYVEPKNSVHLLKVADRFVVLGVHPRGMTVLSELEDQSLSEVITQNDERKDFFDHLNIDDRPILHNEQNAFWGKIHKEVDSVRRKIGDMLS